ncbi:MAG: PqqD family protein [Proteobacteria bacterium]|nr:PqqD family protein [Pseudomonadota bacterium]
MDQSLRMKLLHRVRPVAQVVGDELLLLEQGSGKLHRLNATAAWIYERCDGRSAAAIAAELSRCYEVDEFVALRDVHDAAARLTQLGLIGMAQAEIADGQVV